MLASDVITPVRGILLDPSGTRWTDATLLVWLSEGERTVLKRRPDAGLQDDGSIVTRPDEERTTVGDTLSVDEDFKDALIDYVCYRAFVMDADSTENAKRAAMHLQMFNGELS